HRRLVQHAPGRQRPAGVRAMEAADIMKLLPHRYPMLMVDRIVELEPGRRAVGVKNVTVNEPVFTGHYPGYPIFPGVLIIEAMAQVGGVALLPEGGDASADGRVPLLTGVDKVRFRRPVVPGDQLSIAVTALKVRFGRPLVPRDQRRNDVTAVKLRSALARVPAQAAVDGEHVAEAELRFAWRRP